jgi:aspartyl-tRNA(Asn)/glutamyl-tRNA(Gln) amidotransferase subunit C
MSLIKKQIELGPNEVKNVAKLSNLIVSDKEVEKLKNQLSETLEFVKKLNEIDTARIVPTHSVTGLQNVLRNDEAEPSLSKKQALQNAKSVENGQFRVSALFEN